MDPIKTWTFGEKKNVSDHLKICPYNVKNHHDNLKEGNDEKWNMVMHDLVVTLQTKTKK